VQQTAGGMTKDAQKMGFYAILQIHQLGSILILNIQHLLLIVATLG
jgi:hypothetical protein